MRRKNKNETENKRNNGLFIPGGVYVGNVSLLAFYWILIEGIFQRRKTMKVFITKQSHGKYNYLLNWNNPETGAMMGDWFTTLKELKEYISGWNAILVRVNF